MKPRARWNPYGVGYWTVRSVAGGICYQGVGITLSRAYVDWHWLVYRRAPVDY